MTHSTRFVSYALFAIAFLVFLPALNHQFISLDDSTYVVNNPFIQHGLSLQGIRWAFAADLLHDSPNADYWQPATFLSRMLDIQLFGLKPAGHHFTNMLFHAFNAVLLFLILKRITGALWRSAMVALFFVVHPLQVESVAWVTERKDVLSAFFGLGAIWVYVHYVSNPSRFRMLLVVFLFCFSLMSKPMLVTLPVLLLLLDYWPLKRFQERAYSGRMWLRLLVEKWPLFICSVLSSLLTGVYCKNELVNYNPNAWVAISNILSSYAWYLKKIVWPANLAIWYRDIPIPISLGQMAVLGGLICFISILLIRARRFPYLAFGWFWFLFTLLPAVMQRPADRFTYVSIIGPLLAVVWASCDFLVKRQQGKIAVIATGLILILVMMKHTTTQLGYWRDSLSLFSHAAASASDSSAIPYVVSVHLGKAFAEEGDPEKAKEYFMRAINAQPGSWEAYHNMGLVLAYEGKWDKSIQYLLRALQIPLSKTQEAEIFNNLGYALAGKGDFDQAIRYFTESIRAAPHLLEAHRNLKLAYLKKEEVANKIV